MRHFVIHHNLTPYYPPSLKSNRGYCDIVYAMCVCVRVYVPVWLGFCGPPEYAERTSLIVFICHTVCMYRCMYRCRFLINIKRWTSASLMRTQWPILVKLGMWVVGGVASTTHVVCHHRMHIFDTSFAYLFWLLLHHPCPSIVWLPLTRE